MLGQLLDTLESTGLADDTLVLVSADNGVAGRAYLPLRDNKGSIYEGGHREPFLARWPGRIKPGTTSEIISITVQGLEKLYPKMQVKTASVFLNAYTDNKK